MTNHHEDCDVLNATLHNESIITHHLPEDLENPSDYQCLPECQPAYEYNVTRPTERKD